LEQQQKEVERRKREMDIKDQQRRAWIEEQNAKRKRDSDFKMQEKAKKIEEVKRREEELLARQRELF